MEDVIPNDSAKQSNGKYHTILCTEREFIFASFASKLPLLALFWYSTATMDVNSEENSDSASIAIVIVSGVLAVAGIVYLWKIRADDISLEMLRWYHRFAAVGQLLPAVAMIWYIEANNIMGNVEKFGNKYGTVVNTYIRWIDTDGKYSFIQETQNLGGVESPEDGIAIPYLPPVFALISGLQHVLSSTSFLDGNRLYRAYSGAWLPRFVDYALSTPLIFITNLYFFDLNLNIFTILLTYSTYILVMVSGLSSEIAWYWQSILKNTESMGTSLPIYGPFVAASVAFVLSWVTPIMQLDASARASFRDDGQKIPVFVFLFVAWIFFTFALFPIIAYRKIRQPPSTPKEGGTDTITESLLFYGWK